MLDFVVYLSIFFAIFLFVIAFKNQSDRAYFVTAVVFVIIGIGLFTSGWQTYDVPNYTITDVNADVTSITATPYQIIANIAGTGEQQMVFVLATFFVLVSLGCTGVGLNERRKNKFAE